MVSFGVIPNSSYLKNFLLRNRLEARKLGRLGITPFFPLILFHHYFIKETQRRFLNYWLIRLVEA